MKNKDLQYLVYHLKQRIFQLTICCRIMSFVFYYIGACNISFWYTIYSLHCWSFNVQLLTLNQLLRSIKNLYAMGWDIFLGVASIISRRAFMSASGVIWREIDPKVQAKNLALNQSCILCDSIFQNENWKWTLNGCHSSWEFPTRSELMAFGEEIDLFLGGRVKGINSSQKIQFEGQFVQNWWSSPWFFPQPTPWPHRWYHGASRIRSEKVFSAMALYLWGRILRS